jgi:hypothetical protein
MDLFLAVTDDLFRFSQQVFRDVISLVWGARSVTQHNYVLRPERIAYALPVTTTPVVEVPHARLERVIAARPPSRLSPKSTVMYCATSGAPLRADPTIGNDNVIARIPFGAMVVAVSTENDWVHLFYKGVEGYVVLGDLTDRAAYVYPTLTIGESYEAHDPHTERLRAVIEDEFSYGDGDMPLQAEEYVMYKLLRQSMVIPWPTIRPRTPGTWRTLLADVPQVTIARDARARAVIEWQGDVRGHVAYVEAVFPDGTIQISEANYPDRGIYNERTMVESEWRAYNPVFLSVRSA